MSSLTRINAGLEQVAIVLTRATEVLLQAALVVGLVCLIALIAAGTFGLLHPGDDFGGLGGSSGRGDADIIVVRGILS